MPPTESATATASAAAARLAVVSGAAISSANTGITSARYRGSDSSHVYGDTK